MERLKAALRGTLKKLASVRGRIAKATSRERLCRSRQRRWREEAERQGRRERNTHLSKAERQKADRAAERAQRKLAYWHEQLDKAILGRKELAEREARLKRKQHHLLKQIDQAQPADGASVPDAPWNPYKRPIANWIIPWLEKSWAAGWRGAVNSGWRDPAYSESLCRAMCGAPSCPGRCAGRASNHAGSNYPNGAVDVSDYWNFGAIQPRIGSPLRNALGAQDPVHFSCSGR